jgi:hypothetical protein
MAVFDAFSSVGLIGERPLLVIAGDRAVTSWMSVEAFQKSTGPKELHWIEGASHVDLYDQERYVGPAIAKLTEFYRTSLVGVGKVIGRVTRSAETASPAGGLDYREETRAGHDTVRDEPG